MTIFEAVFAVVSLLIGIMGGVFGAYIGMRVGLVRLETWRAMASETLESVSDTVKLHGEDLLVHDMEIGDLMRTAGVARIRRQRVRD